MRFVKTESDKQIRNRHKMWEIRINTEKTEMTTTAKEHKKQWEAY